MTCPLQTAIQQTLHSNILQGHSTIMQYTTDFKRVAYIIFMKLPPVDP